MRRFWPTSIAGQNYLKEIDGLVREAVSLKKADDVSPQEAAEFVFANGLGLPRAGLIPVVLRSMKAHLDAKGRFDDGMSFSNT